ncbi:MAG: M3 family oligoendopeptidase [Candidatus Zixiibacteriota bacterium]
MKYTEEKVAKQKRRFISEDFKVENWPQVQKIYEKILAKEVEGPDELIELLEEFTELGKIIGETMAWLYIDMTVHADQKEKRDIFNKFYSEIIANSQKYEFKFEKKFYENKYRTALPEEKYNHLNRIISNSMELYREKNIPLKVKQQELSNLYGEIISKMTVEFDGEEKTLQQMGIYQKDQNRDVRKEAFMLSSNRLVEDQKKLNNLFDELLSVRVKIAHNAGFDNYRDFKHQEKGRFDYTPEDLHKFHDSVESEVLPYLKELNEIRKEKLGIESVKPWDTSVDLDGKNLKPFDSIDEFIENGIETLYRVDKDFGIELEKMKNTSFLDLENRKGKSPGGYCMPLAEHNSSFIFMNAVGLQRDLVTLVHESGHTMHNMLSKDIKIAYYKDTPSEIAELASMSMEFLTMEHWSEFYDDKNDLKKAQREQLEGTLKFMPWCMIVDAFQQWIYTHDDHNQKERAKYFAYLMDRFNSNVDWDEAIDYKMHKWLRQLHIFEVPFYYIEYGMSQLGALAVYRNYRRKPEKAVEKYKQFLSIAYSKPLKDTYRTAGIEFDFSREYIGGLVDFVREELDKI